MTNEIKNVPELRFPEFNEQWEMKKLTYISSINPKLDSNFPSSFNYIDLESVNKGKINKTSEFTNENAPSRAQRVAQKGDVFFQTVRPYQQNNFVFLGASIPTVVSTGYAQIRSNINSSYIYNLLLTTTFLNKVLVNCTGSNYPAINSNDLSNILIMISTNKDEQKKIGDFFSKLDRQIELEEQKLEKLEEQKKGYMQKLFSQELRIKDENGNDYQEWMENNIRNTFDNKGCTAIEKEKKKLEKLEEKKKGYMQKLFSQELRFKDENGNDYPEWMETNIRNTFDNKGGTALEKEFDNNGTHKVISIGSYSMNSTYNEQ